MTLTLEQLKANILVEIENHREFAQEFALACEQYGRADHAYRQAQARGYLSVAAEDKADGKGKRTEGHRQAIVDEMASTQQLEQRLAEAKRDGLKARLQAAQTAITAYQSLLNLEREEATMLRVGTRR